jgi:6-phosphofructokinase 2
VTIAGETRTNIVIAGADSERYVKVNEAGPTIQAEEVAQFMDKVRQRAAGGEKHAAGDTWTLCGSLPPGVPDDFYAQIIQVLQPLGVRVLLDTSGAALRLGAEARPFLVKPNTDEAAAFVGHPVETRDDALRAARAFLERGIAQVALSLGAEGLLLATRDAAVFAIPPAVSVKNVTGAGDALLAGLAYALERGLPLAEQARWGVAAGTASAMHEGVGVVTRESVEQIYAGITVKYD